MDINDILKLFQDINYNTEDEKDGKNYRYFHPLRVFNLAKEIIAIENISNQIDVDLILLLALFHDIGRNEKLILENNLDREKHDENNILLFREYVYPLIKDEKKIKRLTEIVFDFSNKQCHDLESKVVRDADNLDEIGILNLWRTAVYAGKHSQDPQEALNYYFNIDRQDKIQKMDRKLFLSSSKVIAKKRLREMDKAMKNFRKEVLSGSDIYQ